MTQSSQMPLEEAAKYLGIPPGMLHSLAWANSVKTEQPKNYWHPTFAKADLDDWRRDVKRKG